MRILAVDDDPVSIRLVSAALSRKDHEILTAANSAEALALLHIADVDALVLDVKVGRGAFMKDLEQARELARTLAGERRGSLLSVVDRTVTGAGGRMLAARLAREAGEEHEDGQHGRRPVVERRHLRLALPQHRLAGFEVAREHRVDLALRNG